MLNFQGLQHEIKRYLSFLSTDASCLLRIPVKLYCNLGNSWAVLFHKTRQVPYATTCNEYLDKSINYGLTSMALLVSLRTQAMYPEALDC